MKIYFIRHGEGNHNKTEDWNILYPRLTERGREQCMKVREEMEGEEVDLILVSPLRRTLETGSIIFKDRKLVGLECIREYIQNPCDYMEKIDEIKEDFKGVDFSKIEEEENKIENEEDLGRRVEKLKEWLKGRKEKNVAIVSHGAFLEFLIRNSRDEFKIEGESWLYNCEIRRGEYEISD